jgi:DNA-directed RNA polymerase subunit RPC12/RpoP
MTMPPENITVVCPKCGKTYEDWYRASMNLQIDDFDEDYIEEASSATCPHCGYKVHLDVLVVTDDGQWVVGPTGGGDEHEEPSGKIIVKLETSPFETYSPEKNLVLEFLLVDYGEHDSVVCQLRSADAEEDDELSLSEYDFIWDGDPDLLLAVCRAVMNACLTSYVACNHLAVLGDPVEREKMAEFLFDYLSDPRGWYELQLLADEVLFNFVGIALTWATAKELEENDELDVDGDDAATGDT